MNNFPIMNISFLQSFIKHIWSTGAGQESCRYESDMASALEELMVM